jgi:predicted nucleic acid-binding protein
VIHFDTSFLIRALVLGSDEDRRLRAWLAEGAALGISAVAWAEFLCGPLTEEQQALAARIAGQAIAFEEADARLAAALFNGGGRRRGTLADCMIAAVAIRAEARLATSDPAGFAGLERMGLALT